MQLSLFYHSDYKLRLSSLLLLPLMMQLEVFDIMFIINCLQNASISTSFCIHSYITFCNSSTRSTTHLKLKHSSKSNTIGQFYFNRLSRLRNSLPTINLDLPISTIYFASFGTTSTPIFNVTIHVLFIICVHVLKCVRLPIKIKLFLSVT